MNYGSGTKSNHYNEKWNKQSSNRDYIKELDEFVDLCLKTKSNEEYNKFIDSLENWSKKFDVTNSQFRKLYDIVASKSSENLKVEDIFELRIMIEYAFKRGNIKSRELHDFFKKIIEKLLADFSTEKKENFTKAFQALLAFSKKD